MRIEKEAAVGPGDLCGNNSPDIFLVHIPIDVQLDLRLYPHGYGSSSLVWIQ